MIAIDLFILCLVLMAVGGAWISKKHGDTQYNEGLEDAIVMHHHGVLTYEVYTNDDGEDIIKLKIKVEE